MDIEQITYRHAADSHDHEESILMLARPALERVAELIAVAKSNRYATDAAGALVLIERTIHDARNEFED